MAITRSQALEYFRSDDLIGLGMEADALRHKLHPENVVTYTVDQTIPYAGQYQKESGSNGPGEETSADLADCDLIYGKIAEALDAGGVGVVLRDALAPELKMEWFERLLRGIKQRFPQVWLLCFSAPELLRIANSNGLSIRDTIARLRDAGLDSIPGNGAQILDDEAPREGERFPCSAEDWVNVHRTAHTLGVHTTAMMRIGSGETPEHRINHLDRIKRLQEETGGFTAFIPRGSHAGSNRDGVTAVECLKMLAISRLYLENIENLQCSYTPEDLKVLQLGLRFGANDAGSVMLDDKTRGQGRGSSEEDVRRVIRDAGFRPAARDMLYRAYLLN